jgi:methanogenic corrinoid protein MtbC1
MTAYRYVRLGMLPARKVGSEWEILERDLEAFRAEPASGASHRHAPWSDRFLTRLLADDEPGAWKVVEAAMAAGVDPPAVHTTIIGPAMRQVGDRWHAGEIMVADEHRVSSIAARIVGRLGPRFVKRGRRRGMVVIGTPPGERHGLPVAMAADLLRACGYEVVDLGADLPIDSFVGAVAARGPVMLVGISVTDSTCLDGARDLTAALRKVGAAPIVVGGRAIRSEVDAARVGADAWFADGMDLEKVIAGAVAT